MVHTHVTPNKGTAAVTTLWYLEFGLCKGGAPKRTTPGPPSPGSPQWRRIGGCWRICGLWLSSALFLFLCVSPPCILLFSTSFYLSTSHLLLNKIHMICFCIWSHFLLNFGQGHLSLIRWIMTVFVCTDVWSCMYTHIHPLAHYTPTGRKKHISTSLNLRKKLWWAGELFEAGKSLPCGREQDKKPRMQEISFVFSQQFPELWTGPHFRQYVCFWWLLNQNTATRDR